MARLPSRTYSDTAAADTLLNLKKGGKSALGEFVWLHQDMFYCIAFIGTLDPDAAEALTIEAFRNAIAFVKQASPKQIGQGAVWEMLSTFIVEAVGNYHAQHSGTPSGPQTDPTMDGSSQMDWETTVILGTVRVKRCINALPEEQKKVFILRHQLRLSMPQVATVMNEHQENIMAWLHRARVQVVKCLGRG